MDELTKGILCTKLLKACDCDISYSIYAFIPSISEDITLCTNNLHTLPPILDLSISLFTDKKIYTPKKSIYFITLKKNEQKAISLFNNLYDRFEYKGQKKIGENRVYAALSYISRIYFDTFTNPVQFFLPHSSVCSGKWKFWDSIDFFSFKEKLQNKEFNFLIRKKMMNSKVWNAKFDLDDFPLIVRRRLTKDKLLDRKLSPQAMIKAMIIKIGESGRPSITYEIIDYSIRELFVYLSEKKYLRVDREIEFLRRLDKEIIAILKENL